MYIFAYMYIFALRAGKITIFQPKVVIFTTFRNQTLQFYSFWDALSSCGVGFRSSCLDQNLVYSWNHPLKTRLKDIANLSLTSFKNENNFRWLKFTNCRNWSMYSCLLLHHLSVVSLQHQAILNWLEGYYAEHCSPRSCIELMYKYMQLINKRRSVHWRDTYKVELSKMVTATERTLL
jgi:hypothetical protein